MANRNESLKDLLNHMEGFVSTKSVIGEPMNLNGMVILPLLDVSLGFHDMYNLCQDMPRLYHYNIFQKQHNH